MGQIKTGIIPAAGMGLRTTFLGKFLPKCMLPVYDRPIIHYIISNMISVGVEDIRIVVHHQYSVIEDYVLSEFGHSAKFTSIHQGTLNGDGGAVKMALESDKVNDPFFVVLGDDISYPNPLLQMGNIIYRKKSLAVEGIIAEPSWDKLRNACSIDILDERITRITEKPTAQDDTSWIRGCGVYAFHPDAWRNISVADNNYCWISNVVSSCIPTSRVHHCILENNININTPDDLLEASLFFKEKFNNEHNDNPC